MNFFPLIENSSLSTSIYYYLWRKSINNISCPNIMLPDTVILQDGVPIIWLFHSSKTGQIMKKNRDNLNSHTILLEFTKNRKLVNKKGCETVIGVLYSSAITNGKESITVEYLTFSGIKHLFNTGGKPRKCILQKYIEPRGDNEEVIRAIWSPTICCIDKRRNINRIYNPRLNIYQRLTTYEGARSISELVLVKGPLSRAIERSCDSIASHIKSVTSLLKDIHNVNRMTVYFKMHTSGVPILLYIHSLSVSNSFLRTPSSYKQTIEQPIITIPDEYRQYYSISDDSTLKGNDDIVVCCDCNQPIHNNGYEEIPVISIIKRFNDMWSSDVEYIQPIITNNKKVSSPIPQPWPEFSRRGIPPPLKTHIPGLTYDRYNELKRNNNFLLSTIKMCSKCSSNYTQLHYQNDLEKSKINKSSMNHL